MKWLSFFLVVAFLFPYMYVFKYLKRRYDIFTQKTIYTFMFLLSLAYSLQWWVLPLVEKIPSQLLSTIVDANLRSFVAGSLVFLEKKKQS